MDLRLVILIFLVGPVSGLGWTSLIQNAAVTWIAHHGYAYWTTPEPISFRDEVATQVLQLANDMPAVHLHELCDRHRAILQTEGHYMSFFDYVGMTEHMNDAVPPESVIIELVERRKEILLRTNVQLGVCLAEMRDEVEETYRFFRFGPDYSKNQVALLEPTHISPCAPGHITTAVRLYLDLNHMLSTLTSHEGWKHYKDLVEVFRPRHKAVLDLSTALEQLKNEALAPKLRRKILSGLQETVDAARTRFAEVQGATDKVLVPVCNTTRNGGKP